MERVLLCGVVGQGRSRRDRGEEWVREIVGKEIEE